MVALNSTCRHISCRAVFLASRRLHAPQACSRIRREAITCTFVMCLGFSRTLKAVTGEVATMLTARTTLGRSSVPRRTLALRAVTRLDYQSLLEFTPDPFGDWASGRHDRLARAELASVGLRL